MTIGNKGVALFMTIALLFLLSIGAATVLLISSYHATSTQSRIERIQAISVAEAGINYAYWKLRTDEATFRIEAMPPNSVSVTPDSNGPTAVVIITGGPLPTQYTINSTVTY